MTDFLNPPTKKIISKASRFFTPVAILGLGIFTTSSATAETKKLNAVSTPSATTLNQGGFGFSLNYHGAVEAGSRPQNETMHILKRSEAGMSARYGLLDSTEFSLGLFQATEEWKIIALQKNASTSKDAVAAKLKQRLYQDHRQVLSLELYGEKTISYTYDKAHMILASKPGYDSPTLGASVLYSAGKMGLGELRLNIGMLNNFEKPTFSSAKIKRETFQEATLISYLSPSSSIFVSGGWNWYEVEDPSTALGSDLQWTKQNYKAGVSGFLNGAALSIYLGQESNIGGPREGRMTSVGASLSFTMQPKRATRIKRPETVQEALANHKGGLIEEFDMSKIDSPITDEKDDFYLYDKKNQGNKNQQDAQEFMILEKELERLKAEQKLAAKELRAGEERELQRQRKEIMEYLKDRKELLQEYRPKYEKQLDEEYEFTDEVQKWRLY